MKEQTGSQTVSTLRSVKSMYDTRPGEIGHGSIRAALPLVGLLGACAPILPATGAEITQPATTPETNLGTPVLPTPTPTPAAVAMGPEAATGSEPLPITEQMVKTYSAIMGFNAADVVARIATSLPIDLGFATGVNAVVDPETGAMVVLSRKSGEKVNYFEATTRSLFTSAGKIFGSYVNGSDDKQDGVYTSAKTHQLALATAGQIRQENLDKGSISAAERLIKNAPGTVMLHNAFEPDKLPPQAYEDLDGWINSRLDQLLSLAQSAKGPVIFIIGSEVFTDYNGSQWNGQEGPLFAQYGDQWPVEVYMRMIEKMEKKGLALGTKVIPTFKEAHILNGSAHAQYVSEQYKAIDEAILARYTAAGKTPPEYRFDIAMEGYFSTEPDGNYFVAIPTEEDIEAGLGLFEGIGGGKVLLDEVAVRESGQVRTDTLARLSARALMDPRVRGIFLWGTFDNSPNAEQDPFDFGTNGLFNPATKWAPTPDYYAFMAGITSQLTQQ